VSEKGNDVEKPILVTGAAGRGSGWAWRERLLQNGLPVHLVNHLATMADLHCAGRYDRMSDDVLTLTGQEPLSLQEFVRKNAATFDPPAKAA
jgi:NAD(P)-dependent dehydrogenase (short-subunit alcohol dehydrogenase family)